ncbi:MAG: S8 family serine peptidase, partial [Thermoanaerobaculia bacterium]
MKRLKSISFAWLTAPAALACLLLVGSPPAELVTPAAPDTSYIVQSGSVAEATRLVEEAGATVSHELGIINAVGVVATLDQLEALRGRSTALRIYPNQKAVVAKKGGNKGGKTPLLVDPDSVYPTMVGADLLHEQGITGTGVTMAVIDSGMSNSAYMTYDDSHQWRLLARYNAITDQMDRLGNEDVVIYGVYGGNDSNGHGTHVGSIAFSINTTLFDPNTGEYSGLYHGVAPGVEVVSVKAFDRDGSGSYADVIRALDWIVTYKDVYGIRVLNLSFSAEPQSHYWDDPL